MVDIAVIGIGCLFPNASGLDEFWQNIKQGHDAIGPVPMSHWRPEDYYDADPKRPDHTYAKTGGFLKPYAFDPLKFGLAPHTLEATDSTQLLGMVCAHEALIDAGYGPERSFDRDRVSCVIGVTGTLELVIPLGARLGHPLWKKALNNAGVPEAQAQDVMDEISAGYVPWQEASFPGLLGNVVAGRIASRLDLGGTNSVVDAACASSLAAVHLAVMELQTGRADMVITGGMDTFNDIFMYMCFSKTPALSPSGSARPYDGEGDGTILGEGLGAILLKRLDDAERDGDRIYGVIRAIGSSSDGKGQAIYAPSAKGQYKALARAYEQAGISARSIELVEGHGTGTKVGDGVELEALTRIYREADAGSPWCQLGSVKSQIGHTKSAAGAAGLIKAVMALHHKILPPTIKVKAAHPKLLDSPFILSDKPRPWVGNDAYPRRAAVSAFGFGGSNFHAVVEEHGAGKKALDWDPDLQILAFSGDSEAKLLAAVQEARVLLDKGLSARGLGRLLRQRFSIATPERLGFVTAGSVLAERLAAVEASLRNPSEKAPLWLCRAQGAVPGKLAFIFAGQGSQEPGMLRDLSCLFPEFLDALKAGNAVLEQLDPGSVRISDRIYPGQAFDEATQKEQRSQLTETRYAQLALGTLGSALIKTLQDFAVVPDAVAGHSYGELLALHAAGVLDRAALLRLSYERGRLMKALGKPNGAMLAVMAGEAEIQKVLSDNGLDLEWANFNADKQIVLGADEALCQKAAVVLKKAGIGSRRLEVSTAFHTSFVEPAAAAFLQELGAVDFAPLAMPVYANLTAGVYPDEENAQKDVLSRQLAQPVRFAAMLRQMQVDGVRTFVEIGPQKKLNGLLKASAADSICLSLDADPSASLLGLGQLLIQLAVLGYPVQLGNWDLGPAVAMPSEKKSFTVEISGANYRNPRPKAATPVRVGASVSGNSHAVTPAPAVVSSMTPRPVPTSAPAVVSSVTPRPVPTSAPAVVSSTTPRTVTPAVPRSSQQIASPKPSVSKVRLPQEGTMSSSNDSWQRLEKIMQDMHDIQRKTADAHTLFLENQRQFQSLLQGMISGESLPTPQPQQPARPVTPPRPATPTVRTPEPAPHKPAPAPVARPAAVQASPAPVSQAAPTPAPKPVVAAPATDHTVLDVLSQCTGYPSELLKAEMNLEGDLGIDSIKKVEIFSQLQTHYPHMDGDPGRLGELQTIGDLLRLTQVKGAASADVSDERVGAWAASTVALAASPIAADQQSILEIVAEKTGFPMAMLQPGMELEADLGIDSIKKVEIFSVIQERIPQLASLGAEELNHLRSISDLFQLLGTPISPISRALSSSAEDMVFQVLSDKTGYPREVLAPHMNLESDLGIDSIKRVEIFSALADLIPDLQSVAPDKVGALAAVSDLLQLAREGLGEAEQLSEQSLLEPDHRHADWDLSKKKNQVRPSTADSSTLIAAAMPGEDTKAGTPTGIPKTDNTEERVGAAAGRPMSLAEALAAEDFDTEGLLLDHDPLDLLHLQRLDAEAFIPQGNARHFQAEHEIWIGDDGSNLARNIMLKLQERGLQGRLVSLAQADKLLIPERLNGLILLAPLKLEVPPVRWLGQAFKLLRRCASALQADASNSVFAVVMRNGGRFGLDGLQNTSQVYGGALAALAKTVAEEWPSIHTRALDLGRDFTDGIEAALRCLEGILLQGPVELGITRDQVFQLSPHDHSFQEESATPALLQTHDLILVTGGARGVTAASLLPLAKAWQPRFVIWGRTPLDEVEPQALQALTDPAALKRALMQSQPELNTPRALENAYKQLIQQREIRENIRQLEAAGSQVSYAVVDVSRDAELRVAMQNLLETSGVPVGIVHGAGVIRDKWIVDQKDEEFYEVLDTKLRLLPYIEDCARQGLRWALLFSSSTARLGRKGQVSYGVANEALNKFAQYLSAQYNCLGLAFNWGPWSGGMVNDGLKKIFASEGVATIPLEAGAALVERSLAFPQTAVHELMVLARTEPLESRASFHAPVLARFEVSIETVPVLLDHVIKQRAVVPAALLLEWISAADQQGREDQHLLNVKDFKVWKGIVLDADQSLSVWVERQGEDVILCSQSTLHKKVRHARAQLTWGTEAVGSLIPAPAALPVDPLCQGLDPYAGMLFHGEGLHLIESVSSCAREGIDVHLRLGSQPEAWSKVGLPQQWPISGEAVDAIFQAAIIWSTLQQNRPCLPAQIGRLEGKDALQPGRYRLSVRLRRVETLRMIADAWLLDEQDEVVLHLEAFEAVMDAGLTQAFRQTRLGTAEASQSTGAF